MAIKPEYEKAYAAFVILGILTLGVNIYYFAYPLWSDLGLTHPVAVKMFLKMHRAGFFDSTLLTKGLALLMSMLTVLTRHGRRNGLPWWQLIAVLLSGAVLYTVPFRNPLVYTVASVLGYGLTVLGAALILYKLTGFTGHSNDMRETFEQCREKVETPWSVNLRTRFQYRGREHEGWVNFVNPFRGTMVLGTPGSGKSFSVYLEFMEQMIRKGYTMFVYDYKYPALTYDVYNILEQNAGCYAALGIKRPQFCVVNFKDPRYSLRCNPLNPKYIKSLTDCTEIADIIMKNLAESDKKDYFYQSAQLYIDCGASFLWIYEEGRYCTFPHLVEFLSQPAEKVIEVLSRYPQLQTKVASFREAWEKKAAETLAGQTTSATVPIAGLSSPGLYWVLSGDDFTLDISNPEAPKVVCVGNDPDNQATYGAALALIFGRLIKLVNHPGNLKSAIMLDEAPTVVIKGLDTLISTARSNLVAVVLGGQDKTQFVRDYGEKYANVVFNTVGNIISGQVNGRTAEELSRMFGKEFREKRSQTLSDDESESIQRSYSQEELMPVNRIETLSQGTFFGKVADDYTAPLDHKLFCGQIVVDMASRKARKANSRPLPQMTSFGEESIRRAILEGGMRDEALAHLARQRLERAGVKDTVTQGDIVRELSRVPEKEKKAFLEQYAETYVQMHVDRIVEENYRRIKADIGDIFEAHGIAHDGDSAEADTEEGEFDESLFGDDGIFEEEIPEPEPVLPVDEEWEE